MARNAAKHPVRKELLRLLRQLQLQIPCKLRILRVATASLHFKFACMGGPLLSGGATFWSEYLPFIVKLAADLDVHLIQSYKVTAISCLVVRDTLWSIYVMSKELFPTLERFHYAITP